MASAGARRRFWGAACGLRLCVVMGEHGWQRKRCGLIAHQLSDDILTSEDHLELRGQHGRAFPACHYIQNRRRQGVRALCA